jgi:hypothetical protein
MIVFYADGGVRFLGEFMPVQGRKIFIFVTTSEILVEACVGLGSIP